MRRLALWLLFLGLAALGVYLGRPTSTPGAESVKYPSVDEAHGVSLAVNHDDRPPSARVTRNPAPPRGGFLLRVEDEAGDALAGCDVHIGPSATDVALSSHPIGATDAQGLLRLPDQFAPESDWMVVDSAPFMPAEVAPEPEAWMQARGGGRRRTIVLELPRVVQLKVQDILGATVPDAEVAAVAPVGEELFATVEESGRPLGRRYRVTGITDSDGSLQLALAPESRYQLLVSAWGYEPHQGELKLMPTGGAVVVQLRPIVVAGFMHSGRPPSGHCLQTREFRPEMEGLAGYEPRMRWKDHAAELTRELEAQLGMEGVIWILAVQVEASKYPVSHQVWYGPWPGHQGYTADLLFRYAWAVRPGDIFRVDDHEPDGLFGAVEVSFAHERSGSCLPPDLLWELASLDHPQYGIRGGCGTEAGVASQEPGLAGQAFSVPEGRYQVREIWNPSVPPYFDPVDVEVLAGECQRVEIPLITRKVCRLAIRVKDSFDRSVHTWNGTLSSIHGVHGLASTPRDPFEAAQLRPGRYRLSIRSFGFATRRLTLELKEEDPECALHVVLEPAVLER